MQSLHRVSVGLHATWVMKFCLELIREFKLNPL